VDARSRQRGLRRRVPGRQRPHDELPCEVDESADRHRQHRQANPERKPDEPLNYNDDEQRNPDQPRQPACAQRHRALPVQRRDMRDALAEGFVGGFDGGRGQDDSL
jgi:hypothetical protein